MSRRISIKGQYRAIELYYASMALAEKAQHYANLGPVWQRFAPEYLALANKIFWNGRRSRQGWTLSWQNGEWVSDIGSTPWRLPRAAQS